MYFVSSASIVSTTSSPMTSFSITTSSSVLTGFSVVGVQAVNVSDEMMIVATSFLFNIFLWLEM